MPRKARPRKSPTLRVQASEQLEKFLVQDADPASIVDHLDAQRGFTTDPYRQAYAELLERFLENEGPNAVAFKHVCDEADAMVGVEVAIRHAGFVMGFEYCRRLFVGAAPAQRGGGQ